MLEFKLLSGLFTTISPLLCGTSDVLGDSSAFLWSFLVNSERPAWPAPLENLYLLSTSSIISTSDAHLSLFQYPLISCKQVRFQLHHTSTHLHKLIQILGGCKWNRNLVYFFKYNLVLCCQNSSLPSLLPYLPRFPCCCCQKLCGRCPCPYFPPWPLLPSKSFLGLYVVHCASVWFLRLSLSFGFLALILPPMIPTSHLPATRLIPTSPALSRAALRHRLPTLFHHPRCRIVLLCLLKSFPSLLRGVSVQSKHKWHQGWPRSTLLLYLPSSLRASFPWHPEPERWQSAALVTRFPVLQIPLLQNKISDTFLKYRYSKLWPLFLPYLPNQ